MMELNLTLDAASIIALRRLAGIGMRFPAEVELALDVIADEIQSLIPTKMHWKAPRPVLASSFGRQSSFGYREVGSAEPHSRRREFGFSGMTDALGRTYTNDPAAFYMRDAIDAASAVAQKALRVAAIKALAP